MCAYYHRNIGNETVRQWLKELEKEDQIHVHVCLTHGDWLYKELERKEAATLPKMSLLIDKELTVSILVHIHVNVV